MKKKILSQICLYAISAILVSGLLIAKIDVAIAGQITFEKEYTYQASEADSKLSCRTIALEQTKRLLLEELGTYLESKSEIVNFQLTKDQITTLTAGIVMAEIIEERWNGKVYFLKAKISADPDAVIRQVDVLRRDRQKTKELEELKKKTDELLRENEKLKNAFEISKSDSKTEKRKDYATTIDKLAAASWYEAGYSLLLYDNYKEALYALDKAIELDSTAAYYYSKRGFIYVQLKNYQNAISDHEKAISLNPQNSEFYSSLGFVFTMLGNYTQALINYDKAIKLNPQDDGAHVGVGYIAWTLKNYKTAIRFFDKAIELNPKGAEAYLSRGQTYNDMGSYQRGIEDMKIAARLGSEAAQIDLRKKGVTW